MSVTQSSHGSASGYEVVHRVLAAVFAPGPGFRRISVVGDVNAGPGIVSIPLAFFPAGSVPRPAGSPVTRRGSRGSRCLP